MLENIKEFKLLGNLYSSDDPHGQSTTIRILKQKLGLDIKIDQTYRELNIDHVQNKYSKIVSQITREIEYKENVTYCGFKISFYTTYPIGIGGNIYVIVVEDIDKYLCISRYYVTSFDEHDFGKENWNIYCYSNDIEFQETVLTLLPVVL